MSSKFTTEVLHATADFATEDTFALFLCRPCLPHSILMKENGVLDDEGMQMHAWSTQTILID